MIKDDDTWNDHISFVETYLPECCRGENFNIWKGYFHAIEKAPELESMIELTYGRGTFISTWLSETEKFPMMSTA